jgi:hypothetical protein
MLIGDTPQPLRDVDPRRRPAPDHLPSRLREMADARRGAPVIPLD